MRYALGLLGVFAVVLLGYFQVAEWHEGMSFPTAIAEPPETSATNDPDAGDAEAERAVLAHLMETRGHTFANLSLDGRLSFASIEGNTLIDVVIHYGAEGRFMQFLDAPTAIIRVPDGSATFTIHFPSATGHRGKTSFPLPDLELKLPLSEVVPGL